MTSKKKIYHFYHHSKSQNYIVAAAIGEKAFREWKLYSYKLWITYCKKNNIGLLVFKDYIIDKKKPLLEISYLAKKSIWKVYC